MLKETFLQYQNDLTNNDLFLKLTKILESKVLSIFKSLGCSYSYQSEFIQDCHIKIFDIACNKHFDESVTDAVINNYFERAFMSVRRNFIRDYGLYDNTVKLDDVDDNGIPLIDKIAEPVKEDDIDTTNVFKRIESVLSREDYMFLLNFIDKENSKMRSVTEVAALLFVSHQAVSKRFLRIKKRLQEKIKDLD